MAGLVRVLHHWRLDPFSRQARIAAGEKGLRLRLREERVWDGRQDFLALSPEGRTPVLVEGIGPGRTVIAGARALLEYLEETAPQPSLLPGAASTRAEARRLADWFDRKFDAEVINRLVYEQVDKRMMGLGAPDRETLKAGEDALAAHLHYINQLAGGRGYLAGDAFSLADVAGAAHISCVAAVQAIDWSGSPAAKAWWDRVSARPGVEPLFRDEALIGPAPASA